MIETNTMPKIPKEIPPEEVYAILAGDYKSLGKRSLTLGLSQEALELLEEERKLYDVKDRTKALELLLRERREARRKKKR